MLNIILYILIGLTAGVLSGFFGIGGGIVIIPALVYILGFEQLKAQGTSLTVFLLPIGILGFMEYYKKGNVDWKAGLIIAVCLIIGSYFGAKYAQNIPQEILRKGFGVIMLLLSVKLIFFK